MRLWGKVACGTMLLIAAIFLIVAVVVPEARRESIAVAAISIAIALLGIPALVKVFSSFTGDEEILTNGVVGSATITSLEPTGWRSNRQYPIVKFNLNVDAGVRVRASAMMIAGRWSYVRSAKPLATPIATHSGRPCVSSMATAGSPRI